MKCMKCGREMESDQAFCPDCLLEMEKYPVKPDVHVHLPVRPKVQAARKQALRRKNFSPEEQIRRLKKRVMILTGALIVTLALLFAMGVAIGMAKKEKEVAALSGAIGYLVMNTAIMNINMMKIVVCLY